MGRLTDCWGDKDMGKRGTDDEANVEKLEGIEMMEDEDL